MLNIINIARNNRGIALLITVSVTTILVAAVLEHNRRARFTLVSAAAARDTITLNQMAASGVNVAMAILTEDKANSNSDSLQEDWAKESAIEEILAQIPFEDGRLSVKIGDELSKIQVNALLKFPDRHNINEAQILLWNRLLSVLSDEEQMENDREPMAIINSVKDWLDSGDDDAVTGLNGAESDYYKDQNPPYVCRNAPIPDLTELLLIKGITPELFYGSPEKPGISQFLTVYGLDSASGSTVAYPGRININTAEPPVLAALMPLESEELVEALYEFRQEAVSSQEIHDFSNPSWYKEIPGLSSVRLDPNLITTSSDLFRIDSAATLHDAQITTTAVVQRVKNRTSGKWTCQVLSWETK
jgi:general secretion pathway protein K